MIERYTETLRVDKNIVPLLSKSTYLNSFAHAVREIVSNSYDADALKVNIDIDKNYNNVVIEDDGNGMSKEEFKYYCTIAGQKRDITLTRKYKRKRVGLFGIGFLSVFPFSDMLEIETKVENSSEILTALIPTKNYFKSTNEVDIGEIEINCSVREDEKLRKSHYTKITLRKPSFFLEKYFSPINTKKRDSILTWKPYDKFIWELQEDLPLPFKVNSEFNSIIKYDEPIGMVVNLNGKPLYRNEPSNIVLESGKEKIGKISYKYVITTNYTSIRPQEARGLKIRLNNVGIGSRTDFELSKERGYSRLHWLNGEIHFTEAAKEYLSLNRDSFISDPQWENVLFSIKEKLKKQAYFVEEVAVAEKTIETSISENRTVSYVKSKKELIDNNLKTLANKGFKIKELDATSADKVKDIEGLIPIVFDKKAKTVTIINRQNLYSDSQKILNKKYNIVYKNWSIKSASEFPACKLIDDNTIEINESYPLFKSKQYGNVFKKIHMLLLVAYNNSKTSSNMYEEIMEDFLKEFKEFK